MSTRGHPLLPYSHMLVCATKHALKTIETLPTMTRMRKGDFSKQEKVDYASD